MRLHVFFSVLILAVGGSALAGPETGADLKIHCSHPQTLKAATPDYETTVEKELAENGIKEARCTSCYRSESEQRAACINVCGNPEGCPGRCAKPGNSQHQKQNVATCDIGKGGLPIGARGCLILMALCNKKYGGNCGIGGYPGGGFHFGVGPGYNHFSSWNQCKFLKDMSQAPGGAVNVDGLAARQLIDFQNLEKYVRGGGPR